MLKQNLSITEVFFSSANASLTFSWTLSDKIETPLKQDFNGIRDN